MSPQTLHSTFSAPEAASSQPICSWSDREGEELCERSANTRGEASCCAVATSTASHLTLWLEGLPELPRLSLGQLTSEIRHWPQADALYRAKRSQQLRASPAALISPSGIHVQAAKSYQQICQAAGTGLAQEQQHFSPGSYERFRPRFSREGSQASREPSPRPHAPSGAQPSPPGLAATSQPAASRCAVTAEKEILLRNLALRDLFQKRRKLNQTKPRSHAEPVPFALSRLSGGRGCSLDPPRAPLTCVAARRQRAVWSCTWV